MVKSLSLDYLFQCHRDYFDQFEKLHRKFTELGYEHKSVSLYFLNTPLSVYVTMAGSSGWFVKYSKSRITKHAFLFLSGP